MRIARSCSWRSSLAGGAAVWLIACAMASAPRAQGGQEDLPPGPGLDTFRAACSECHDPAVATGMRLSRDDWKGVVQAMIDRGAMISADESSQIVEYLTAHFGTTLNINQAIAQDIERFFPTSQGDAAAIVRFRETNGTFKEWDDLARVPGIDLGTIAAKKAAVRF